jgi:hypothetical protein
VINEHQTDNWDAFGTKFVLEPGKSVSVNDESDPETDASDNESEPDSIPSSSSHHASCVAASSYYFWNKEDKTTITFTEERVSGKGGNCAFNATGTERRKAIKDLKARTNDEEIRQLIWTDMQAANPTLIGTALPAKKEIDDFLEKEFIADNQYMSYIRPLSNESPSGTFVALAKTQGFGLTIFAAGKGNCLTHVCIVPKLNAAAQEYFLLHTGYEKSPGRHVLNHFNLLVQSDDQSEAIKTVTAAGRGKKKSAQI